MVFKEFCGLLGECIIPFSGINQKVRDIKILNENLVHFEAFQSLNFRDSYILLIDTQKIVYCAKPNWKIDFKISCFFKMKYATFTEPYNFDVHEADEDLQMELHCHLVSK
jgi:hypothetical protein